ncbi:MAG: hypothetical protein ACLT5P_06220 [Flavonifractor plautii]
MAVARCCGDACIGQPTVQRFNDENRQNELAASFSTRATAIYLDDVVDSLPPCCASPY